MKAIKSILKRKALEKKENKEKELKKLDEKTIICFFLEVAKREIKNLKEADFREIKLKNKILYIKTIHPLVKSELFLRRKDILKEINKIAYYKTIEKLVFL